MGVVVIWADEYFPILGGLEKALHRTAEHLIRLGHQVIVVTLTDGLNRQNLSYRVIEVGREVFFRTLQSVVMECSRDSKPILYIARLFIDREQEQLKLLERLSQHTYTLLRIPSTWSRSRYNSNKQMALIDQAISGFICLNRATYDLIGRRYRKKQRYLVYNWEEQHTCSGVVRDNYMWAGRFCYSKNVIALIEAWKELAAEWHNSKQELHLYGGEFQDKTIENKIRSLIEEESSIVLFPSYHRMGKSVFCSYKYVVLPSFREGCPNVLVESYSAGTPVIGSCVPGVSEHIKAVNGMLIEKPLDKESIKRSLRSVDSTNKKKYYSLQRKIIWYFNEHFTREYVAEIIEVIVSIQDKQLPNKLIQQTAKSVAPFAK